MSSPPQTAAPPSPTTGANPTPTAPTPAPTQGSATYLPVPIPAQPGQPASFGAAVLALVLMALVAFVLRTLWRLPEAMAHKQWVRTLGGQYAAQNRLLHLIGYLAVAGGVLTGQVFMGLIVAGVFIVAANTRPQGGLQDTPA